MIEFFLFYVNIGNRFVIINGYFYIVNVLLNSGINRYVLGFNCRMEIYFFLIFY